MSSNNIWDPEAEDFEATSEGMSSLRAAYKALKKEHASVTKERDGLVTERDSLKKTAATASLDSLTASLPAGVKKFLMKDFEREGTEPTEANVKTWLAENGADFGYDPTKVTSEKQETKPAGQEQEGSTQSNLNFSGLGDEEEIDPHLPAEIQAALRTVQQFEQGQQAQNLGASKQVESLLNELDGKTDLSAAEVASLLKAAGAPMAGY